MLIDVVKLEEPAPSVVDDVYLQFKVKAAINEVSLQLINVRNVALSGVIDLPQVEEGIRNELSQLLLTEIETACSVFNNGVVDIGTVIEQLYIDDMRDSNVVVKRSGSL